MVTEAHGVQSRNKLTATQPDALRAYTYYSSTVLTENMCLSRSFFQRAPAGMDVCLFTSLGDRSVQSLRGPAPIPVLYSYLSSTQLAWLQQRSWVLSSSGKAALPPAGRLTACTTHQGLALGPMHLGRVSGVSTALAAAQGHVRGVNRKPQFLHCRVCAAHPCGRQGSPSWGGWGGETELWWAFQRAFSEYDMADLHLFLALPRAA